MTNPYPPHSLCAVITHVNLRIPPCAMCIITMSWREKRKKKKHLQGFEICDSHILKSRLETQQDQQSGAF